MSYRIHTTGRAAMEAAMAQRVTDLIAQRAKALGIPAKTLVNQIVPAEQAPVQRGKRQVDSISNELLRRLAARDAGN